eukprot:356118-Chlamydomonas_euryale.AAC.7
MASAGGSHQWCQARLGQRHHVNIRSVSEQLLYASSVAFRGRFVQCFLSNLGCVLLRALDEVAQAAEERHVGSAWNLDLCSGHHNNSFRQQSPS